MSIEVSCGSCDGRLIIETAGVVVACPHCGVHLSIPAEHDEPQDAGEVEFALDHDADDYSHESSNVFDSANSSVAVLNQPTSSVSSVVVAPPVESQWDGDIELPQVAIAAADDESDDDQAGAGSFVGSTEVEKPDAADAEESPALATEPLVAGPSVGHVNVESTPVEATDAEATAEESPVAEVTEEKTAGGEAVGEETTGEEAPLTWPGEVVEEQHWDIPAFGDLEQSVSPESSAAHVAVEESSSVAAPASDDADALEATAVTDEIAADDTSAVADDASISVAASGDVSTASEIGQRSARKGKGSRGRRNGGKKATTDEPELVPKAWLMYAVSYAGAVTLAFLFLLFSSSGTSSHELESLPDLVPPTNEDGEIAYRLAPANAELPPGHELRLGEEQRFGNLLVKPLKITKGPLQFRHFIAPDRLSRAGSMPVLKLWLEFKNVSDDQTFAPLDRTLVLTRHMLPGDGVLRSNNMIRTVGSSDSGILMYDMPVEGEWEIVGTEYGKRISPNATWTTFVPSEDVGLDAATGELVWRLQLRKGYNPESRRGVTTLIDVRFNSADIQSDPIPAKSA